MKQELSIEDTDRIVEMAWEDRTPFDAILMQFGVSEKEVIKLMRREMKASSFRMWRKRVQGRKTKHLKKRNFDGMGARFKCSRQKYITDNKISKVSFCGTKWNKRFSGKRGAPFLIAILFRF